MLLILLFGFFLFLVALLRSGDFSVAAFVGYIDGEFIWLLLRNDGGFIVRGYIIDFVVWVPISFEASLRSGITLISGDTLQSRHFEEAAWADCRTLRGSEAATEKSP